MTLPTLPLPENAGTQVKIRLEPLTPSAFATFGTVITSPLARNLNNVPPAIPRPIHHANQPVPIFANQNTAIKTSPISPLTNNYPDSKNGKPKSKPQMSMFSCFPRKPGTGFSRDGTFKVGILERHPFTTQTFLPLGLNPANTQTCFLVVVAPTLSGTILEATFPLSDDNRKSSSMNSTVTPVSNPPDLSKIRAFLARGDQAVTYGAGTWHAPMVVLGAERVDFVVTQFVNGVPDDDCQEVLVGGDVTVDLKDLKGWDLDINVVIDKRRGSQQGRKAKI